MSNIITRCAKSRSMKMLAAFGAAMALAGVASAQTDAGRTVSNTFTLDYSVNNTPQPPIDNTGGVPGAPDGPTIFTVDRLIDLTLAETNSPQFVAPGTTADPANDPNVQPAVLSYRLTNTGNDTQAYTIDLSSATGTFAATDLDIFYLADDGSFVLIGDVATGTANPGINFTEDVPAGDFLDIFVVANIPAGAANAEFDDIVLTAQTRDPVAWAFETPAPTTPGAITANETGANDLVNAAQNVFADGDGDGAGGLDADADGLFTATAQFIIASPNLTGVKTVQVLATDGTAAGFNCSDFATSAVAGDQFSTPGACVEYTITVTNLGATDDGTPTGNQLPEAQTRATGITIADILPAELTYLSSQAVGFTVLPTEDTPLAANTDCTGNACDVVYINGELTAFDDPAFTTPSAPGQIIIRALVQ